MIEVFLPFRIGYKFIIPIKVLFIYIRGKSIYATLVNCSGKERKIIKTAKVIFEVIDDDDRDKFIANTINKMVGTWKYDYSRLIITPSEVIFKILHFPFSDQEKIKMIAPFEVEQSLPFALSECSMDSLVLANKDKEELFTAISGIIKQENLSFYRAVYSKAGLILNSVTVDCIEVIANHDSIDWKEEHFLMVGQEESVILILYKNNNILSMQYVSINDEIANNFDYEEKKEEESEQEKKEQEKPAEQKSENTKELTDEEKEAHKTALIEIEENISLDNKEIYGQNLKLDQSLLGVIKFMLKKYGISSTEINLYTVGIDSKILAAMKGFEKNINFKIKDYVFDESTKNYEINYEEKVSQEKPIEILKISAISSPMSSYFNLGQEEEMSLKKKVLSTQIIVTLFLTIALLLNVLIWNFIKINDKKKQIKKIENEYINFLRKEFGLSGKGQTTIDKTLDESKKFIEKLKNGLPTVVIDKKGQFLNILEKLSESISKDVKGLVIHELKWKNGEVGNNDDFLINAEVSDWASLHLFEQGLRASNVFVGKIPSKQDIKNMNYVLQSFKNRDV